MKSSHRAALAAFAVAATCIAPSASAAPVDVVTFAGSFTSTCTMPYTPAGPRSGPYSCAHTATAYALGCVGAANWGPVTNWVTACRANLTRGKTKGNASQTAAGYSMWTCDNGAGTGTLAYQPSPSDPTFRIPVTLVVLGQTVVVNGSVVQRSTGRTMVVRARFPAVCAASTTVGGYQGTVTPA